MPLFMDMHKNRKGLTDEALAAAHKKDLQVQSKYGVKFVDYWYNKTNGTIFCLCEAPNKEAASAVHKEAHGDLPDEVIEVERGA